MVPHTPVTVSGRSMTSSQSLGVDKSSMASGTGGSHLTGSQATGQGSREQEDITAALIKQEYEADAQNRKGTYALPLFALEFVQSRREAVALTHIEPNQYQVSWKEGENMHIVDLEE